MKLPIYLDNNATTPTDPEVIERMGYVMKHHYGNPASSTHAYGWQAEELVRIARKQIADLINAKPEEIIWTSGATESNNLALKGLADCYQTETENRRFVSVKTEHKSVLEPLEYLTSQDVEVSLLDVTNDGIATESSLSTILEKPALCVSIMLANNEIGVIQDIAKLSKVEFHKRKFFHCDASQALGKIHVDVQHLNVDIMSFSAHKMYGPKGIGALYIRQKNPKISLVPLLHGGGHERGFRSGTLNLPAIVGFGHACKLAAERIEKDQQYIFNLTNLFLDSLKEKVKSLKINGSLENRIPGNLNICFSSIQSSILIGKVCTKLALSNSSACQSSSSNPSHVLSALGLNLEEQHNSIRIGIGRFNTKEEVLIAANVISSVLND